MHAGKGIHGTYSEKTRSREGNARGNGSGYTVLCVTRLQLSAVTNLVQGPLQHATTTFSGILSSLPCYHSNQQVHNKKNIFTDYCSYCLVSKHLWCMGMPHCPHQK